MKSAGVVLAMLLAASLAGCAALPRPLLTSVVARPGDTLKTKIDQSGEAELYLETGYRHSTAFEINPIERGDPLPNVQVGPVSLTEAGVYQAMHLMTRNTDLTVSITGGPDAAARYGAVSVMNIRGTLASVLDRLSHSMGFFYSVHDKYLQIEPERQFFIDIPPALNDDNAAGIANTMQALGARDIYLDRSNRTMVLRVNQTGYERVARYLKKIRDERAMIVYEVSVFQVDLTDQNETGVQWNRLAWAASGGVQALSSAAGGVLGGAGAAAGAANTLSNSITASQTTGFGLGLVLNSSKFGVDSLVTFLQTQGSVKSLSSPRIAIMAGTKGTIRVGNTLTYVSKIGSNTSVGLSQITTETKDLHTGLDLSLFGEVSDKTVYSRIALSLSELIRMKPVTTLGNMQELPETAEREVHTEIRARPGDMILLGGVTIDRSTFDVNRGLMVNGSSKQAMRSELVVALKPKLVHFSSQEEMDAERAAQAAAAAAPPVAVTPVPVATHAAASVVAEPFAAPVGRTAPALMEGKK